MFHVEQKLDDDGFPVCRECDAYITAGNRLGICAVCRRLERVARVVARRVAAAERASRFPRCRAWERRQRDRRRAAGYSSAHQGEWRRICARDGWQCWLCWRAIDPAAQCPDPGSGSVDHVVPVSRGGMHVDGNLRAAHRRCNTRRGNRQRFGAGAFFSPVENYVFKV